MDVFLLTVTVCLAGGGAVLVLILFVNVLSLGFAVWEFSTFDAQAVNMFMFGRSLRRSVLEAFVLLRSTGLLVDDHLKQLYALGGPRRVLSTCALSPALGLARAQVAL